MDPVEKLTTERNALLDKVDGILNAANGLLTEEQQKEVEELQNKADELKAQADKLQADAAKTAELANKQKQLRAARLNPIVNRLVMAGGNAPVHVGGEQKFRLPSNVIRVNPTNFAPEPVEGREAEERAYRFGQWALANLAMSFPGQYRFVNSVNYCVDEGLLNVHGEGGSDVSGAGVFVPDEFMYDVIRLVESYGVIRSVVTPTPMSSDTLVRPRRVGGLTAYFVGEQAAGTESDVEWNNVRLTARKLMVLTRMSSELAEDSVMSIANMLLQEIALAIAFTEDNCAFNGTGTSTFGGISGVRTNLGTLTAGTDPGLVAGAGSTWASLTLTNHTDVISRLPQYADTNNTAWFCSRQYYFGVMVPLINAAGGQTQAERIMGGRARPMFQGYPVVFSQVFPTTTASATIPVILGDLNQAAMFGDRRSLSITYSTEATVGGQSMWERDQIGVKATTRFDFNNHDFGSSSAAGPVVGLRTT